MDKTWPSYMNVRPVHMLLYVPADLLKFEVFISVSILANSGISWSQREEGVEAAWASFIVNHLWLLTNSAGHTVIRFV
jgi:hypothetical protein